MSNTDLWKQCTAEQSKNFILSLQLLGNTKLSQPKQIACLYAISNHTQRHYQPVTIPKRDGTPRHLLVPKPHLKIIQKNILHTLLDQMVISPYAMAYHKGGGIIPNASVHTGQKQILKLDIKDFFGNIIFPMVYKCAFPYRYYPPSVSTLLTSLCCYKDYLPQGSPTSAAISNLVMRPFDDYMGQWAGKQGIKYTRYCDDMTFSGDFNAHNVINKVRSYLQVMGFTLNEKKTKILTRDKKQYVTGIIVNTKPQVSRQYRKELRQEIYYCRKFGAASHLAHVHDETYLPLGISGIEKYLMVLLGKVNFILQVNPQDKEFQEAKIQLFKLIKALN